MRTLLILACGLFVLAGLVIYGKLLTAHYPNAVSLACYGFIAFWLLATGFNMWVGVSHAGYSIQEELPIMLLLFGVPALAALVIQWKLA